MPLSNLDFLQIAATTLPSNLSSNPTSSSIDPLGDGDTLPDPPRTELGPEPDPDPEATVDIGEGEETNADAGEGECSGGFVIKSTLRPLHPAACLTFLFPGVGDKVLLSYAMCGKCDQCTSGHPAYCYEFPARNFGGKRPDGSTCITTSTPSASTRSSMPTAPSAQTWGPSSPTETRDASQDTCLAPRRR